MTSETNEDYAQLLGDSGPLATHVEAFAPRHEQQALARAVGETLETGGLLVAEAGTGTGKTFAYLVPLLASGTRAVISTATRTLQDQLFRRDLPLVREALAAPVDICLLKGRANYLCLHRMDMADQGESLDETTQRDLARVRDWAGVTRDGDVGELAWVAEDSRVWPLVTSTVDNCLGSDCPVFEECHVLKARRAAQQADVVVVNHHLLFADMVLKEEGFGELLPGVDAVILDEAHKVESVASRFLGVTVSSRRLLDLARDSIAEHSREAGDMPALPELAWRLEGRVRNARLALGGADQRLPWSNWQGDAEVSSTFAGLRECLNELLTLLEEAAGRGRGLEQCARRAREALAALEAMEADEAGWVRWAETSRLGFQLHRTPLEVADTLRTYMDARPAAWIFTSATLSVGGSFDHATRRLGVPDARTLQLDSPFDYARRALLYLPPQMPDPNAADYHQAVIDAALPVIRASGGGAFFLFTSHRALRWCARHIRDQLDYPVLVQGEAPRGELIQRFREHGNSVLLGSQTFWEGVDVRGTALRVVIIDRLPFAAPSDPVLQARLQALRDQGRSPFVDYQLPEAVITLKQGVGRLIRDVADRGVVMLCDPRLRSRGYGRLFLDSLPALPRTEELADVEAFFAGPEAAAVVEYK